MLTSVEISQMQLDALGVMPDAALVYRATPTSDGMGGQTLAWATVDSATDCRVDMASGLSVELAARLQGREVSSIWLPADTDVEAGDRILVNNTTTYEVVWVSVASWEILTNAICARLE